MTILTISKFGIQDKARATTRGCSSNKVTRRKEEQEKFNRSEYETEKEKVAVDKPQG